MNDTCLVDECGNQVKRMGYCYGHYMKNWRYGTPTPTHQRLFVDLTGRVFGKLTVVQRVDQTFWECLCSCGAVTNVRTGDLNRGSAQTCGALVNRYRSAARHAGTWPHITECAPTAGSRPRTHVSTAAAKRSTGHTTTRALKS